MARRRALARVSGRSQQFPAGDALALAGALDEAAIVTLASAATVAIGAAQANTIQISGTTTITSFDTVASGAVRRLVFSGALTLTHNATKLILPGAANITTAAGDAATFVSLGGGSWRCVGYQLGGSVGGGTSGVFSKYYESAQYTIGNRISINIAHGLGVLPKLVTIDYVCKKASSGYSVGDVLEMPPVLSLAYYGSNAPVGLTVVKSLSAIQLFLSSNFTDTQIIRRDGSGTSTFIGDNFNIVVKAYA